MPIFISRRSSKIHKTAAFLWSILPFPPPKARSRMSYTTFAEFRLFVILLYHFSAKITRENRKIAHLFYIIHKLWRFLKTNAQNHKIWWVIAQNSGFYHPHRQILRNGGDFCRMRTASLPLKQGEVDFCEAKRRKGFIAERDRTSPSSDWCVFADRPLRQNLRF